MNFYSKILLFGEYAVIKDAKGLSIPFLSYKGSLAFTQEPTKAQKKSHRSLLTFYDFLLKKKSLKGIVALDLEAFNRDLKRGLYFESSIPQGYGIGSSGALVAAIYDNYCQDKLPATQLYFNRLKHIFSIMESHFHGKSSGLDPLSSYVKEPLVMDSKGQIKIINPVSKTTKKSGQKAVFLLDSGNRRNSSRLAHSFFEALKKEREKNVLFDQFVKDTNFCIDSFLKGDVSSFFKHVKNLSMTVLRTFDEIIPKPFLDVWKAGIETGSYFLKLCGSGDGGYILGFTDDVERAKKDLSAHKVEVVMVF